MQFAPFLLSKQFQIWKAQPGLKTLAAIPAGGTTTNVALCTSVCKRRYVCRTGAACLGGKPGPTTSALSRTLQSRRTLCSFAAAKQSTSRAIVQLCRHCRGVQCALDSESWDNQLQAQRRPLTLANDTCEVSSVLPHCQRVHNQHLLHTPIAVSHGQHMVVSCRSEHTRMMSMRKPARWIGLQLQYCLLARIVDVHYKHGRLFMAAARLMRAVIPFLD